MTTTVSVGHIQLFSATSNGPIRWRLLSGNNRDAGRGTDEYPDVESCRIGIKSMQSAIDEFEGGLRRAASNEWIWQLSHLGRPVAVSGRGFDRMIRCEQGLAQFLRNVREAEVGAALMVSSSRRW